MFGKLPRIHDFVRVRVAGAGGTTGGAVESFESWLTQAVAWHEASRQAGCICDGSSSTSFAARTHVSATFCNE